MPKLNSLIFNANLTNEHNLNMLKYLISPNLSYLCLNFGIGGLNEI